MRSLVAALLLVVASVIVVPHVLADAGPSAADAGTAAFEPPVGEEVASLLDRALVAIKRGSGVARELAAIAVMLIVLCLRRVDAVKKRLPKFFGTDRGGVVLAFTVAFLGAAAHAVLAGSGWGSLALWKGAFVVGLEAIGFYAGPKKLLARKPAAP